MSRMTKTRISFILLGLYILWQPVAFADKSLLAAMYIFVFVIAMYLGQRLASYSQCLLYGVLTSAVILAMSAMLVYAPEGASGIYGLLGQKNLFANWIASGLIIALWYSRWMIAIMLSLFMLFSGSKTVLLYLPIILWVAYARLHRS